MAVNRYLTVDLDGCTLFICLDSQAAIKVLQLNSVTSRLVWECIGALNKLEENLPVKLIWVLGHSVIKGNEELINIRVALVKKWCVIRFDRPLTTCGLSFLQNYRKDLRINQKRK